MFCRCMCEKQHTVYNSGNFQCSPVKFSWSLIFLQHQESVMVVSHAAKFLLLKGDPLKNLYVFHFGKYLIAIGNLRSLSITKGLLLHI